MICIITFSLDDSPLLGQRYVKPMCFLQRCRFAMCFIQRYRLCICFIQHCGISICCVKRCKLPLYSLQRYKCVMKAIQRYTFPMFILQRFLIRAFPCALQSHNAISAMTQRPLKFYGQLSGVVVKLNTCAEPSEIQTLGGKLKADWLGDGPG